MSLALLLWSLWVPMAYDRNPECATEAPLVGEQARAEDALRSRLGADDDGRDITLGTDGTGPYGDAEPWADEDCGSQP